MPGERATVVLQPLQPAQCQPNHWSNIVGTPGKLFSFMHVAPDRPRALLLLRPVIDCCRNMPQNRPAAIPGSGPVPRGLTDMKTTLSRAAFFGPYEVDVR